MWVRVDPACLRRFSSGVDDSRHQSLAPSSTLLRRKRKVLQEETGEIVAVDQAYKLFLFILVMLAQGCLGCLAAASRR